LITNLRAALLCEKVEQQPDGRIDIIGVRPDVIRYPSMPNFQSIEVFLTLDLDAKGSTGHVRFDAPNFAHRVPFSTPPGINSSAMVMRLVLPLTEPGTLTISVVDGANRLKPFKAKWQLAPATDLIDHGQEKVAEVIEFANGQTTELLATLHGRKAETH
jgi:hypothetical protein